MKITNALLQFLFCTTLFLSCKKDIDPIDKNFITDNTWEFDMNGTHFHGSIDTSFTSVSTADFGDLILTDTILTITGTSDDKKTNVLFYLYLTQDRCDVTIDTSSTNFFHSDFIDNISIDYRDDKKIKGTFSGEISSFGSFMTNGNSITNGKFNFDFIKNNKPPKYFSYIEDGKKIEGFTRYAEHRNNTLILEGFTFNHELIKIHVYTGGNIKPGTYKSKNGEVGINGEGFLTYSIYSSTVNKDYGDIILTISSFNDGIVQGNFSGSFYDTRDSKTKIITAGSFKCIVKKYSPEQDAENKWRFVINDFAYDSYNIVGGNSLKATMSFSNGLHKLELRGESDHGKTQFRLNLQSPSPFVTGNTYKNDSWTGENSIRSFNCVTTESEYLLDNPYQDFSCHIESLTTNKIIVNFTGTGIINDFRDIDDQYPPSSFDLYDGKLQAEF